MLIIILQRTSLSTFWSKNAIAGSKDIHITTHLMNNAKLLSRYVTLIYTVTCGVWGSQFHRFFLNNFMQNPPTWVWLLSIVMQFILTVFLQGWYCLFIFYLKFPKIMSIYIVSSHDFFPSYLPSCTFLFFFLFFLGEVVILGIRKKISHNGFYFWNICIVSFIFSIFLMLLISQILKWGRKYAVSTSW